MMNLPTGSGRVVPASVGVTRAMAFLCCLVAGCGSGADRGDEGERLETTGDPSLNTPELPRGEWVVVARTQGKAVLAPVPRSPEQARTDPARGSPTRTPVLFYSPASGVQTDSADVVRLTLPDAAVEPATVTFGAAVVDGLEVVFTLPGSAPVLLPSPNGDGRSVFEHANQLWLLSPDRRIERSTAARVGAFDFDQLSRRQREGEVILYWAAVPVWSPDGGVIAYATNREAVAAGERGQSVWIADIESGSERQVVPGDAESHRPIGWLGRELLTIGSEPGVWAVDPLSGSRRQISSGLHLDVARDGSAVALADEPGATPLIRLADGSTSSVPPPPAGYRYSPQALFSPRAGALLLEVNAAAGAERRFLVFSRAGGEVEPLEIGAAAMVGWPQWLTEEALLISRRTEQGVQSEVFRRSGTL